MLSVVCQTWKVLYVSVAEIDKNITSYQRDLLKMRADHATSLLPNPIVVWPNESTRNMTVHYLILCLLVIRLNNVTVQGGCVISSHIVD